MARTTHSIDRVIIQLLQRRGYIKKEAEAYLRREVYQLQPEEVAKIKNYSEHFGLKAKDKIIQEILELRREALFCRLSFAAQQNDLVA